MSFVLRIREPADTYHLAVTQKGSGTAQVYHWWPVKSAKRATHYDTRAKAEQVQSIIQAHMNRQAERGRSPSCEVSVVTA